MSALVNNILKTVNKNKQDDSGDKIKKRAGMIINVFAALLAFNTYVAGSLNSTILNNTIKANDVWAFYQAKSIKQTMAEYAREDAQRLGEKHRVTELTDRINRYESEPASNEGKRELFAQAKKLEAERDVAKKKSPWIGYASTAYQLSIVLLSTSILTASILLFWGSFAVAGIGIVLMTQGLWLWF